MPEEIYWEYVLSEPVRLGEREITELQFRRPRTKDFIRADGYKITTVSADVAIASALSGESEALIAELPVEDWAIVRIQIGKIWSTYFGIKPKSENPTKAAPKKKTPPEAASL